MSHPSDVTVEFLRPEYHYEFTRINREWLINYDLIEPQDEVEFADPHASYIAEGGMAWVAHRNNNVIATCAILSHGSEAF